MFDEFWEELIAYASTLDSRVVDEYGNCSYRGLDGRACLVGHFLSDELAQSIPNGASWVNVVNTERLRSSPKIPEWMILNVSILNGVQGCHDRFLPGACGNFGERLVLILEAHKDAWCSNWRVA